MVLSSLLIGLFVIVFVAILIAYSVLSTTRPNILTGLSPITGDLQTPAKIGNPRDVRESFLSSPGSTCMVYVFCSVNGKTPEIGNSQEPITLLKMGNAVQLQILPGGVSTPPSTKLVVKTQGGPREFEEIPLPYFPQQKWVQVAIVKEGRRFTVYYNGKPVSSQRTIYFPIVNSSQMVIGDPRLKGRFALPKIAPTPMRVEEIQDDLANTSDTRHEPYLPTNFSKLLSLRLGCPNGVFCFSTSSPPTENPLKMWQTPYA